MIEIGKVSPSCNKDHIISTACDLLYNAHLRKSICDTKRFVFWGKEYLKSYYSDECRKKIANLVDLIPNEWLVNSKHHSQKQIDALIFYAFSLFLDLEESLFNESKIMYMLNFLSNAHYFFSGRKKDGLVQQEQFNLEVWREASFGETLKFLKKMAHSSRLNHLIEIFETVHNAVKNHSIIIYENVLTKLTTKLSETHSNNDTLPPFYLKYDCPHSPLYQKNHYRNR